MTCWRGKAVQDDDLGPDLERWMQNNRRWPLALLLTE